MLPATICTILAATTLPCSTTAATQLTPQHQHASLQQQLQHLQLQ
jgi:hypothetical protein